jgi:hypothetical protein
MINIKSMRITWLSDKDYVSTDLGHESSYLKSRVFNDISIRLVWWSCYGLCCSDLTHFKVKQT